MLYDQEIKKILFNFDLENSDDLDKDKNVNKSLEYYKFKNYLMDFLIKQQIPFLLKNAIGININEINKIYRKIKNEENNNNKNNENLSNVILENKNSNNNENIQNKILKILFSKKENLKISISQNNIFSGQLKNFSQIETNLNQYIDYEGNLNLYLSQINIKEKLSVLKENNFLQFEKIKKILEKNFNQKEFNSINIWHSYKKTISKFHYDFYENFLFVYKGKKYIELSPYNSNLINSDFYGENSINQINKSNLMFSDYLLKKKFKKIKFFSLMKKLKKLKEEILKFFSEEIFFEENFNSNENNKENILKQKILLYSKILRNFFCKNFILKFEINEGETLYIPEGYWHKVITIGNNNLAFNFWWNNFNNLLDLDKEKFLIKSSLFNLLGKFLEEKGKLIVEEEEEFLNILKENLFEKNSKKILNQIFGKFPLNKYIALYYTFENIKNNENINDINPRENWTFLIKNFWQILFENKKSEKFLKRIRIMKRFIINKILKDLIN